MRASRAGRRAGAQTTGNVKLGLPKAFRAQGAQSSVLGRGCRSDLYRRMG